MSRTIRIAAPIALLLAAGGVLALKGRGSSGASAFSAHAPGVASQAETTRPVPRLLDLGAGKCIPCKAMAPILERLRADYAGRIQVDFIDVWQNPEAASRHRVEIIPTQVFFAPDGRELARHQGFMSREEILDRWKALGVAID